MMLRRLTTVFLALALSALALPAFGQGGGVDFTRYVAIGDSLTAGFQSGGLVGSVSRNSYPALIHRQATGSDAGFDQPLVSEPGLQPLLELRSLAGPVIAPRAGGPATLTNPLITRPYNNLAVPGANVRDVLVTTTGGLHDLVLQQFSPVLRGKSALQQALLLNPTFVTIWVGNNDALRAATSGIVVDDVTLTSAARFDMDFRALVAALAGTGAKLAIANVPDVTTIPFVSTLSRFVVNPATNQPVLGPDGQPVRLIGPNGLLNPGDHVLLSASAELRMGKGIPLGIPGGTGQPLSDSAVLSADETARISARIAAFNATIAAVAQERNAAFVDTAAVLQQAATRGISIGGITFTTSFLTGGIFSFDGVHPTSFGYAYIANVFIQAINAKFGSRIPPVDLFPFIFGGTPTGAVAAASAASSAGSPAAGAFVPFEFTAEAKKSLFWGLGIKEQAQARPPRRPRHHGRH